MSDPHPTRWRRNPLPKGWYKTRLRILKRDQYRCTWIREDTGLRCTAKGTDVDHIDPRGGEADSNLRALCGWHHRQKTSAEGGRGSQGGRDKPTKKHPGLW